ncbi:MAG: hypothetical protein H0W36_02510 [Gemmatimonadetes bacterium]|nr:hypothetical protein [Gemmatimonadota bacterium]
MSRQIVETGRWTPLMHGDAPYVALALPPAAILGGCELARLFGGRVQSVAAALLAGLAILGAVLLVAWQSPRVRAEAESVAALRRAVSRTWPDPTTPVPQLVSPAFPDYHYGAPWPPMDWSLLHLDRPIRAVSSQELARTGSTTRGRYLVFLPERDGMPPEIRWRTLVRSQHAALVELR